MNTLDSVRKAPSNKTLGIEIELFVRDSHPKADELKYRHHGFFYAGTDASLRWPGSWLHRGIEFVSQPLTHEWMKRELRKLYKMLGEHYAVNQSCGIHVHVSKKWLSVEKATCIWKFFQTLDHMDFEYLFGRKPNDYCMLCRHSTLDGIGRYAAINITNSATVEFRMFRSGGPEWAAYCVDMAKYLTENARTINLGAIYAFRDMYPKEMV